MELEACGGDHVRLLTFLCEEAGPAIYAQLSERHANRPELWKRVSKQWRRYIVMYWRDHRLNEPLLMEGDETPTYLGVNIYMEAARALVLGYYDRLGEFAQWIIPDEELLHWMVPERLWERPVMLYTQWDIRCAMHHLAGACNSRLVSWSNPHVRRHIKLLELKNAMLFCESLPPTLLDDPDEEMRQCIGDEQQWVITRPWAVWSTVYFVLFLGRSRFWYETIPECPAEPPQSTIEAAQVRAWCEQTSRNIGEEFETILNELVYDAYAFPGDGFYMAWRWPNEVRMRQNVLFMVHGDEEETRASPWYSDYQSSFNLDWQTLLEFAEECHRDARLTSLYVLELFNRWFLTTFGNDWRAGYVIEQADIESQFIKIRNMREPLIIWWDGHYQVMWQAEVVRTRNIYETLATWLSLVLNERDAHLFDRQISLKPFYELLDPAPLPPEGEEEEEVTWTL